MKKNQVTKSILESYLEYRGNEPPTKDSCFVKMYINTICKGKLHCCCGKSQSYFKKKAESDIVEDTMGDINYQSTSHSKL